MRRYYLIILLFFAILVQGCGYRFGQGGLTCKYQTICIPFVLGDKTGELTATLVKEISKSGAFQYRRCGADIVLRVAIIELYDENVGFRYDRDEEEKKEDDMDPNDENVCSSHDCDKKGKREDNIIPTETRITAVAEVSVEESSSGCTVLAPARIYAYVDFDHDYYFGSNEVIKTSLGQLTDIDAAHDSVQTPLYNALAEKIVDYVIHSW